MTRTHPGTRPKVYHKDLTKNDLNQLIIEIRHGDGIITPRAIASRWGISQASAARLIMIHNHPE